VSPRSGQKAGLLHGFERLSNGVLRPTSLLHHIREAYPLPGWIKSVFPTGGVGVSSTFSANRATLPQLALVSALYLAELRLKGFFRLARLDQLRFKVWDFGIWSFEFLSNFGLRISSFHAQRRRSVIVVKLLRVHGGCLGIERRRKTWQPAICLGKLASKRRSEDF
jgi:hypothetical protein